MLDSMDHQDVQEEERERLSEAAFGDGMMLDSMDHQDVQEEERERCALSAKYINAKLAKRREANPELGVVDPELDALMKPQILYAFLEVMSQESLKPFGSMNKLASTNKYHSIANMTICFNFMYARAVLNETDRVIGSAPRDIVDGNKRKTLDLIWTIITRFQQAEVEEWERNNAAWDSDDEEAEGPGEAVGEGAGRDTRAASLGLGKAMCGSSGDQADADERVLLQEVMESFGRQEGRSGGGSKVRRGRSKSESARKASVGPGQEGTVNKPNRSSSLTSMFGSASVADEASQAGQA
eukprot:CAMPEP_0119467840 /NCGR_PEP_ID=MMETSP1344-20130328/1851_1 /TAXON_ID=236787 /ORGANISM="Florenciella parvula, Strain CCMP2471" /LENGTH=296 /DNA_ID=CAMNT_0007500245 /DNA_START=1 /DNA_END=888 /DNA_ORIENTATION=+